MSIQGKVNFVTRDVLKRKLIHISDFNNVIKFYQYFSRDLNIPLPVGAGGGEGVKTPLFIQLNNR